MLGNMPVQNEGIGHPHDEGAHHVDHQGAIGEVAPQQQRHQLGDTKTKAGADGTAGRDK
ncbi:hypothetical protein D3C87_1206080 [compost metagenome]